MSRSRKRVPASNSKNPDAGARTTHETFDYSSSTRLGLAAVSGLLLTISFPLFHEYLAAWVAIAVLMAACAGAKLKIAALCGFLHGVFFFGPTLTWLATVFQAHGGVAPFAANCVFALIVAVASLFTAAFAWAFARIARRSLALACIAAPFLYILQEFAKGRLPGIGFPWNLIGYAAANSFALLQLATIGGVWLLGWLVVAFNSLLFYGVAKLRTHRSLEFDLACAAAIALALVAYFGPRYVSQDSPYYIARLVQPNFPLADTYASDWMQQNAANLDELTALSTQPDSHNIPATWVIWPEVPAPFSMQDPRFLNRARQIAQKTGFGFLVGEVDWKLDPAKKWRAYNSAAELDPSGRETFLYDKIHLVPFAEHVPFSSWFRWVQHITVEVGNFEPGTQYKVGALPDGHRFGVFICYEAIFPNEVRQFAKNGAEVLVTISDDGWFGRSAAPSQHLAMARVRAVENRRWLLRSTNNGYTVDVDPYGRLAGELPTDVRAALSARYAYRDDVTLYTQFGDWLPWLSLVVAAASLIFASMKPGTKTT